MLRFTPFLSFCLAAQSYYPGLHDDWEKRASGFDAGRLSEAITFAKTNETKATRDLRLSHDLSFGREMYGEPLGPFKERGGSTGVILKDGYIAAEWGDPWRVDMTFSVTKSFLSSTVAVAVKDGLIGSVHDPVRRYVTTGEFEAGLNQKITWDHLLRQTSDWEGTAVASPTGPIAPRPEKRCRNTGQGSTTNRGAVTSTTMCG